MSYEVLVDRPVWVPVAGQLKLRGDLTLPVSPWGIVLFAHGSGSSRFDVRNRQVAAAVQRRGLGTLLLDLLTANEHVTEHQLGCGQVDVRMLGRRLLGATDWLNREPSTMGRPVGYFGAGASGAAALLAATRQPEWLRAVVTRDARPDVVEKGLTFVIAPTLLIVDGENDEILAHNRRATAALRSATTSLSIVRCAGQPFGEAAGIQQAADVAADWYSRHLGKRLRPVDRTTEPNQDFELASNLRGLNGPNHP